LWWKFYEITQCPLQKLNSVGYMGTMHK
jgi:hypothetical protein